jgi:trk system potassium uptake protein TrkA
MRSFAVIGMSSFGYFLCKALGERGLSVLAIDNNEAKIDSIKQFVDRAVIADATDKETLASLGINNVDVVIVSLGDRMDASILVTHYLRELKVREIVAKASTEDHGKLLNIVGATSVIFPEKDMAERLANILKQSSVIDYFDVAPGYSIVEIAPPPPFIKKTLQELDLRNRYDVQVIMIKEVIPENIILIPRATHIIKDSDILVLLGRDEDIAAIQKLSE